MEIGQDVIGSSTDAAECDHILNAAVLFLDHFLNSFCEVSFVLIWGMNNASSDLLEEFNGLFFDGVQVTGDHVRFEFGITREIICSPVHCYPDGSCDGFEDNSFQNYA